MATHLNLTDYQNAILGALEQGGTIRPNPEQEPEMDALVAAGLASKRGGGWYTAPDRPERGRPYIGSAVTVRLDPDLLAMIDDWAERNAPSRAEAIRMLLRDKLTETA